MSAAAAAMVAVTAGCLFIGAGWLADEAFLRRLPPLHRVAYLLAAAALTLVAAVVLAVTWTGGR